ncbi:MAG: hypothetical protein KDC49_16070 [Saprospiraceae bacterium]|nr:hypothetical protein [Saprospiraceae bacterium]
MLFLYGCKSDSPKLIPSQTMPTDCWYRQWEMFFKVENSFYEEASTEFVKLTETDCLLNPKVFSNGLFAMLKSGKENEANPLFSNGSEEDKRAFCFAYGKEYDKLCSEIKPEIVSKPYLRDSILRLYVRDQYSRGGDIRQLIERYNMDTTGLSMLLYRDSDHENEEHLKKLITTNGFPTANQVGKDGMDGVFYIVQHSSDINWQKSVLAKYEELLNDGSTDKSMYAYLSDRINIKLGNAQLYGTQVKNLHFENNEVEFFPIEDSIRIDERRMAFDLEPLEFYKKLILKAYSGRFNDVKK